MACNHLPSLIRTWLSFAVTKLTKRQRQETHSGEENKGRKEIMRGRGGDKRRGMKEEGKPLKDFQELPQRLLAIALFNFFIVFSSMVERWYSIGRFE